MDINNIKLTNVLIEELYPNLLVKPVEVDPTPSVNKTGEAITGENYKHFTWIVFDKEHFLQSDEDFQFLTEILNACRLNMTDIILINANHTKLSYNDVIQTYNPEILILSNVPQNWHSIESPLYSIQPIKTCSILLTDSLEMIRKNKSKKSQLWLALKQMLNL